MHLSMHVLGALNGHYKYCFSLTMTPVFVECNEAAMMQSLDPCKISPDICSGFLVEFSRCPIKHNERRKLKRGLKVQANLGGPGGGHDPLENFEIILAYKRCDFTMYFGGKKRRKRVVCDRKILTQ